MSGFEGLFSEKHYKNPWDQHIYNKETAYILFIGIYIVIYDKITQNCYILSCLQDTQLLLWDLSMDEVVMPLRRLAPSGGSPTLSSGSGQASYWDNPQHRFGVLQAPPVRREVPKLSPVVAHRVHVEPLSGILFTKDAILTVCHEGHVKVWTRPDSNSADTSSKDANSTMSNNSSKLGSGHSKHWNVRGFFHNGMYCLEIGPFFVCLEMGNLGCFSSLINDEFGCLIWVKNRFGQFLFVCYLGSFLLFLKTWGIGATSSFLLRN